MCSLASCLPLPAAHARAVVSQYFSNIFLKEGLFGSPSMGPLSSSPLEVEKRAVLVHDQQSRRSTDSCVSSVGSQDDGEGTTTSVDSIPASPLSTSSSAPLLSSSGCQEDAWGLLSLISEEGFPGIDIKFVRSCSHPYQFSVDSFFVILDPLISKPKSPFSTHSDGFSHSQSDPVAAAADLPCVPCPFVSYPVNASNTSSTCDTTYPYSKTTDSVASSNLVGDSPFTSTATAGIPNTDAKSITPTSTSYLNDVCLKLGSWFGATADVVDHLSRKLIVVHSVSEPAVVYGGCLLKYAALISQGYEVAPWLDQRALERYMCARFQIDFPEHEIARRSLAPLQLERVHNYLSTHFSRSQNHGIAFMRCLLEVISRVQNVGQPFITLAHTLKSTICMLTGEPWHWSIRGMSSGGDGRNSWKRQERTRAYTGERNTDVLKDLGVPQVKRQTIGIQGASTSSQTSSAHLDGQRDGTCGQDRISLPGNRYRQPRYERQLNHRSRRPSDGVRSVVGHALVANVDVVTPNRKEASPHSHTPSSDTQEHAINNLPALSISSVIAPFADDAFQSDLSENSSSISREITTDLLSSSSSSPSSTALSPFQQKSQSCGQGISAFHPLKKQYVARILASPSNNTENISETDCEGWKRNLDDAEIVVVTNNIQATRRVPSPFSGIISPPPSPSSTHSLSLQLPRSPLSLSSSGASSASSPLPASRDIQEEKTRHRGRYNHRPRRGRRRSASGNHNDSVLKNKQAPKEMTESKEAVV